jgi:hypothetical protein
VSHNLSGNLSDFPGPGDLPGCGDPRKPMSDDEARSIAAHIETTQTGRWADAVNDFLHERGRLTDEFPEWLVDWVKENMG